MKSGSHGPVRGSVGLPGFAYDERSDMKVSELLEAGSEVLIERGLAQCVYVDGQGHVCASAALHIAAGGTFQRSDGILVAQPASVDGWELSVTARGYVRLWLDVPMIEMWNDEPGRTVNDVCDAFHEAALLAKADGL